VEGLAGRSVGGGVVGAASVRLAEGAV